MSLPENVRSWLEGASLARLQRDTELAVVEANRNIPLDRRHDWLETRKIELQHAHYERVADAARA